MQLIGKGAEAQLRTIARKVLSEELYSPHLRSPGVANPQALDVLIAKSTSDLPPRSGTSLGSVACNLFYRSTGNTLTSVSTSTETVYNVTLTSINAGTYFPIHRTNFGSYIAGGPGVGEALKIGVLTANLAHGAIGTLRLHDQTGTSLPVERSPIVDLSVLNITGTTMKSGPWMYGEFIEEFDQWIVHPAQIEGCLTPEFDPDNTAVAGGAVTAAVGADVRYDPDGAGGAVTITFPESTTLQDGETFRITNVNQSSTTTISLAAHGSTPLDKIEDPTDRTAAYASSVSSIVTTRYVVDFALDTNNYANPTWKVANLTTA